MARNAALALFLFAAAPVGVALAQEQGEAAEAHEGHGGEHHGGPVFLHDILSSTEFWGACLNFVLLLLVLRKLGKQPLSEFLVSRRKEMEQSMAEAADMKAKAEARYNEYTQRIAQLDQELAKLESDIARAAEEDKKRIVAEAEESARRLKRETESLVDQYAKALSTEVRHELVAAAITAAEKVLREGVNATDQQSLADRYKAQLASAGRAGEGSLGGGKS